MFKNRVSTNLVLVLVTMKKKLTWSIIILFVLIVAELIFLYAIQNQKKKASVVTSVKNKPKVGEKHISEKFITELKNVVLEKDVEYLWIGTYTGTIQKINKEKYILNKSKYFGELIIGNSEGITTLKIGLAAERLKVYKFYKLLNNGDKKLISLEDLKVGQKIKTSTYLKTSINGESETLEIYNREFEIRD